MSHAQLLLALLGRFSYTLGHGVCSPEDESRQQLELRKVVQNHWPLSYEDLLKEWLRHVSSLVVLSHAFSQTHHDMQQQGEAQTPPGLWAAGSCGGVPSPVRELLKLARSLQSVDAMEFWMLVA